MTNIFFAFTAGSLWLLSFLFLMNVPKVNGKANSWLGIFYIFLACAFTQFFIEAIDDMDSPLLVHLMELPRWAIFPSFYIAIRYFVNPSRKPATALLHFVPAGLFLLFSLIYIIPNFFNQTAGLPELPLFVRLTIRYFFLCQIIIYWCLCYAQLNVHVRNIRLVSSTTDEIDLAWIKYILYLVLLLAIVYPLGSGNKLISFYTPAIYFMGVSALAYFSLTQGVIYDLHPRQIHDLEGVLNKKLEAGRLTLEQVTILKSKVITLTENEKLYLEPGLTLPALSEKIGISTHELSYVLNAGLSKNFYQFINEMRVEEAKRLLTSKTAERLDMLGIATNAGFNSKTTFNTTFKKMTGKTPSEFSKHHNTSS